MSDGTKFFKARNLSHKNWYTKRVLSDTNNRVTHRLPGFIDNCVPAIDCMRETTLEEARVITSERADAWSTALLKYCKGEYGGNHGVEDMWRESKHTAPLFGAYGERL